MLPVYRSKLSVLAVDWLAEQLTDLREPPRNREGKKFRAQFDG